MKLFKKRDISAPSPSREKVRAMTLAAEIEVLAQDLRKKTRELQEEIHKTQENGGIDFQ